MARLDETTPKVKYITHSNVPSATAEIKTVTIDFPDDYYDEPYDVLVIRDLTGTVAYFEKLRGDKDYIEFLNELLDAYWEIELGKYQ